MSWFSNKRTSSSAAPAGLQATAQAAASPQGLVHGRYRLGPVLGQGAGSQVHEAVDLRTGATVALKIIHLPPDLPAPQRLEWAARLQREAELSRKLNHPGIVAVVDAGLQAGQAWLAMERVRGVDLGRYTQPQRRLPEDLVLRIGSKVALALAHAHAHGVVHRDLKPANVIVDLAADQVKLADFGVARDTDASNTRTGLSLGTPAYMAPEQLAGEPATAASDTYALGVMLFELLASRRPHEADTLGDLLRATASQPPATLRVLRPDLPAPAAAAVETLLARKPADRPADLEAWAAQVAALAALMTRLLAPGTSTGH